MAGKGYFNSEHIYLHTSAPDESIPFDWETFAASPATVRLGAFRCDTGEEVYWGLEDVHEMADLLPRCQASSSMPVLMPIVYIDGVPYLDGGLGPTGGFAIDAAAADGYRRMLVVSTVGRIPQVGFEVPRRLPAAVPPLPGRGRGDHLPPVELQPDYGGARGGPARGARLPLPARPHGGRQWRTAL